MLLDKIINKIKFINYTYHEFYAMIVTIRNMWYTRNTKAEQENIGGRI